YDADACLARGHWGMSFQVSAGTYFLVADAFSDGVGNAADGAYSIDIRFLPDDGPCALSVEAIARIGTTELPDVPASGAVVLEPQLVTEEDWAFTGAWPTSLTDQIPEHSALSENASGSAMDRAEPWAPCCQPSNKNGQ